MKQIFAYSVALCCRVTSAFACWQTDWPRVVLPTQSVNLRLKYNDGARDGRIFRLHKAVTLHPEPGSTQARYEKKLSTSAKTDSPGLVWFGEVEPGTHGLVGGILDIASDYRIHQVYIQQSPVRKHLCERAEEYAYSSTRDRS